MSDETPHDKLQDQKIKTLEDDLKSIKDEKLNVRVSNIETSIKIGKWVVGVIIVAIVGRFVMQTDAGFEEIKTELREVRTELKEVKTRQMTIALALASEKKNKPTTVKEFYDQLTSEKNESAWEWESEEELLEKFKKTLDAKDVKKLEEYNTQQMQMKK